MNMNRLFLKLLFIFVFVTTCEFAFATSINVMIDRDPVNINESFQIIFESTDSIGEPDFSPLNENFRILGKSRQSSINIINGDMKRSSKWVLTVMANKTGTLKIPAIQFGTTRSKPSRVEVKESGAGTGAGNNDNDIYIDVKAEPADPYVQSQVIYTVKLFRAIETGNASLSEPDVKSGDAVIKKLGDDKDYEIRKGGKQYEVTERRYAIFPQHSGEITIEPVVFQGQTGSASRFFIDPFGPQPKTIVSRSKPVTFNVKSIPESFSGTNWLPAHNLEIQEQWSASPLALKAGEPATRTLKIIANGLPASLLPDIQDNMPGSFKQYPDQPKLHETTDSSGVTGVREEKIAVIPGAGGKYTLPEIRIPWWNMNTGKMDFAVLPARTISVQPAAATPAIEDKTTKTVHPATESTEKKTKSVSPPQTKVELPVINIWKWLAVFLALGWCVSLFFLRRKNRLANSSAFDPGKPEKLSRIKSQLKKACQANDAVASKDYLLRWAKLVWPENSPANLADIGKRTGGKFYEELFRLNQVLYSANHGPWDGNNLFSAFSEAETTLVKTETGNTSGLEPLYRL